MLVLPLLLAVTLDARGTRAKASAQGRLREALGLENVEVDLEADGGSYFRVKATLDETLIGFIEVSRNMDPPQESSCRQVAEAGRSATAGPFGGWFSVDESWLMHRHRGRGIGLRMYEAALRHVTREGGVLVSDNVYGGNTSEDATKTWSELLLRYRGGWAHLPGVFETGFWAVAQPVEPEAMPMILPDGRLVGPGEIRTRRIG